MIEEVCVYMYIMFCIIIKFIDVFMYIFDIRIYVYINYKSLSVHILFIYSYT